MFHRLSSLVLGSLLLALAFTSTARADVPTPVLGQFIGIVRTASNCLGTAYSAYRVQNVAVLSQSLRATSVALQGASGMVPSVVQLLQQPHPIPSEVRAAAGQALQYLPTAIQAFNQLNGTIQRGR